MGESYYNPDGSINTDSGAFQSLPPGAQERELESAQTIQDIVSSNPDVTPQQADAYLRAGGEVTYKTVPGTATTMPGSLTEQRLNIIQSLFQRQLKSQGYTSITIDPETGAVVGTGSKGTKVLTPEGLEAAAPTGAVINVSELGRVRTTQPKETVYSDVVIGQLPGRGTTIKSVKDLTGDEFKSMVGITGEPYPYAFDVLNRRKQREYDVYMSDWRNRFDVGISAKTAKLGALAGSLQLDRRGKFSVGFGEFGAEVGALAGYAGLKAFQGAVTTVSRPKQTLKGLGKMVVDPIGTGYYDLGPALKADPLGTTASIGGSVLTFRAAIGGTRLIGKGVKGGIKYFKTQRLVKLKSFKIGPEWKPGNLKASSTGQFSVKGYGGKGSILMDTKKPGLPIKDTNTGAILRGRQLQLKPKDFDILTKSAGAGTAPTGLNQYLGKWLPRPLKPGAIKALQGSTISVSRGSQTFTLTKIGKGIFRTSPGTQTQLSSFGRWRAPTKRFIGFDIAQQVTSTGRPGFIYSVGRLFRGQKRGSVLGQQQFKTQTGQFSNKASELGGLTGRYGFLGSAINKGYKLPRGSLRSSLAFNFSSLGLGLGSRSTTRLNIQPISKRSRSSIYSILPRSSPRYDYRLDGRQAGTPALSFRVTQLQRQAQRSRTRQASIGLLKNVTIPQPTYNITPPSGRGRGRTPQPRTPPPDKIKFDFSLKQPRRRSAPRRKGRVYFRTFSYKASVLAGQFNIKGRRPKVITGIRLRPLAF